MTMRINFNEKLDELQRMIVELDTKTIKSIEESSLAFIDQNLEMSQKIVDEDPNINRMESELYNYSALLIAEQQLVARDFRIILNAKRSGHVLERIADSAVHIAKRDIEFDHMYAYIFKELLTYMHEDPSKIEQCMTLLFICRRLERIADQTTHLCGGIIYIAEGQILDLNT